MTSSDTPPAAIRLRRSFEREGKPKGYQKTARLDGGIGPRLLCCLMLLLYKITVPLDRSTV